MFKDELPRSLEPRNGGQARVSHRGEVTAPEKRGRLVPRGVEGLSVQVRQLVGDLVRTDLALHAERTERQRMAEECEALASERLRAEAELRASERHLLALVRCAMDAIVTTEADGRVVLFNPAAERIFRCPARLAVGHPVERFIPRRLLDRRPGDLASHCSIEFIPGGSIARGSLVAVRADGDEFLAEATLSQWRAGDDRIFMITLRDLTEQRRAEEALSRLSRAVEQTADGVCITDVRGVIEYVNPAFERLLGFAGDQMIGRTPALFGSADRPPAFYDKMWSTLLAGDVFRWVFIDRRADGDLVHLDQTITPIKDGEGRITHFVASARDVTPRVRTEEALRRVNESLEVQARSIAQALHDEAGQLLTSAHIAAAEAARGLPPAAAAHLQEVRRHLDGIEGELRRLSHELRPRILDDLGLVPALDFLASGVERRYGMAISRNAGLTRRLPPHVENVVYRVVQEALGNAGRHAGAKHVTISLEEARQSLHVSIADDGVGFDADSAFDAGTGDGIGLRGIRDRLAAIGGTLRIESSPGRGTRLSISLPLEA